MNERIQQMIYSLNEKVGVHWTNEDKLKFAELIVQDCVTKIAMIGISNFENDDISWTVDKSIQNIRKHFGIE